MSSGASLAIGAVARRAGLRTSALRYYESAGLIHPLRLPNGRRAYDAGVFESLALIRLAQDAGFSIAEVRTLLHGFDHATPASARWRAMAERKRRDLTEVIERAARMRGIIDRLLLCECDTLGECVRPRLVTLARKRPGRAADERAKAR